MTGKIPLFKMTIVGPLLWDPNGHEKSKNPVNNHGPRKMEALRRSLREAVRTGFHPPGCDTLRSQIDHEIGHHFAGLQRVLSGGTIVDEDLLQYVKASLPNKSVIAREVSRKAIRSDRELLAEAWAEYRNSDAPRPVALWIGKFLERKAGIR